MNNHKNRDDDSISRFSELAEQWWDPQGPQAPLHWLNSLRCSYITSLYAPNEFHQLKILDVGCGGGLLTEALTKAQEQPGHTPTVTGIDLSSKLIAVAEQHALEQHLAIQYQCIAVEDFLNSETKQSFDLIVCMELLEHVPDPYEFLKALKPLLKPGGRLVCSTLNRSAASYLGAIVGAEYILKWLPVGTHQYKQFLKPSELAFMGRQLGLSLENIQGVSLNPVTHQAKLSPRTDINYFIHWQLQES